MSYYRSSPSALRLFLRALAPSAGSLAGSLLIIVGMVGFHMLLLSREADLLLPHFTGVANDQIAEVYAVSFLQPIDRFLANSAFSTGTTALIWGAVGLIVYSVADFLMNRLRELRSSNQEITMPRKDQVIQHPLHRQIIIRLLWRFLIGIILISLVVGLQPVVAFLFKQDVLLLRTASGLQMMRHAGIIMGGWLLVLHLYVILFRLFVMRTRVFGEIIY